MVLAENAVALVPGIPYPVYACQIHHALREARKSIKKIVRRILLPTEAPWQRPVWESQPLI